ncbi:MAG: response regulator [Pseudomonadota bacterium]
MVDETILLYVEDNEADVLMLKHLFARHRSAKHLTIEVSKTVADAIAAFDAGRHSAVLVDWVLPDGTGAAVGAHVRAHSDDIPLIYLSGIQSAKALEATRGVVNCHFIKKGHTTDYVDAVLRLITN